jgi:hypothetical protein
VAPDSSPEVETLICTWPVWARCGRPRTASGGHLNPLRCGMADQESVAPVEMSTCTRRATTVRPSYHRRCRAAALNRKARNSWLAQRSVDVGLVRRLGRIRTPWSDASRCALSSRAVRRALVHARAARGRKQEPGARDLTAFGSLDGSPLDILSRHETSLNAGYWSRPGRQGASSRRCELGGRRAGGLAGPRPSPKAWVCGCA